MNLHDRINAFSKLGNVLHRFILQHEQDLDQAQTADQYFSLLSNGIQKAYHHNNWFTEANVLYSIRSWAKLLNENSLNEWLNHYTIKEKPPKSVAVIMAGNIPLVGFHDFLCVLITGHRILIKESSNDNVLLKTLCDILFKIEPRFEHLIRFTNEQLKNYDAVIATGSNNTARYFEYYFSKYPHVIRKNRNSVAVLRGNESLETLEALSDDIFRYYGLGCRNVSKLYVPEDYDFNLFFNAIYKWHPVIHEHKYANNYDYNKAVYLMSEYDILDNGFLVLKQDPQLSSPIASLNYEYYNNKEQLKAKITHLSEDIQCVVSEGFITSEIPFGETQSPGLSAYADDLDTVEFLLTI
jgi:hypothetical protein